MQPETSHCWCGSSKLVAFDGDYFRCAACETLVLRRMPGGDVTKVGADEAGLYGKEYWFDHQEHDVGFPNITQRSRADLPERCVHWLRAVLKYKLPPARTLELGAAHGGFVALLRRAGFNATGLELSPWIADFARRTFAVPMLQGPVERQPLEPGGLDLVMMMDVIEHLLGFGGNRADRAPQFAAERPRYAAGPDRPARRDAGRGTHRHTTNGRSLRTAG